MSKQKNTKFLILQAIGIILVVLGHKGGINLFTDWFPIYSFHMPLFIFISGYFYKTNSESNLISFIKNKSKRLLIPYFAWNLIYGIIFTVLTKMHVIDYSAQGGELLSLRTLFVVPWLHGHQFIFNLATWFVLVLFLVQISYTILRKICKYIKVTNEYFFMILFLIIGLTSVILSNKGYITSYKAPIIKVMFSIPFFHFGYLYKEKLESKDNLNNIAYFIILFATQLILLKKYVNLGFSVAWLNNFNKENIFLPFLTSLTGILFWLRISKILVKSFEKSKIVEYIGSHTWDIMTHHIFIFFLINLLLSKVSPYISINFNYELFKTDIWYSYVPINGANITLFYSIASISIPLLIRYSISNIKYFIINKRNHKTLNTNLK